jgi:hypothetical protein
MVLSGSSKVEPLRNNRRLWISYTEAGQRCSRHYTVGDDNDYFSIVAGGRLVWDSRSVVPCDMARWYKTFKNFKYNPAACTIEERQMLTAKKVAMRRRNSQ